MVIHELNKEECFRLLARARLARLACAYENQPYVVPVYLAYHLSGSEACLYGFTTPGQKIQWMRANPLVCVEVDEVTSDDQWVSVIAFGRYEELSDTGEHDDSRLPARAESSHGSGTPPDTGARDSERLLAHEVLQTHAMWWAQAVAARAGSDPAEPFIPIFYKVCISGGRPCGQ
jgi:nitroimidazol reductase NimA-like FMN-containing flavoprotein (pyridoxamine 5'-phosphate oxidase superfamily)